MNTKNITRAAAVAAVYFALTVSLPVLSYGPIQFRISEVLTLLAYYNPIYIPAITIGAALSNLTSPLGIIDVIVGSMHSFISLYFMSKSRSLFQASLFPALFSFIIGLEIVMVSPEPISFIAVTLQIMLSEAIVVTLIGVPLFKSLQKHPLVREKLLLQSDPDVY